MKIPSLFGSAFLVAFCAVPGFGLDLLDRMLGANGCGCKLTCCEVASCAKPAPTCGCEAAPTCGVEAPTCGIEAPTCGCEAPTCGVESPACGCEVPAKCCARPKLLNNLRCLLKKPCVVSCTTEPTCEAPASCCTVQPACGCDVEPACGCDRKITCRKPGLLDRLFSCRKCCSGSCVYHAEPACGWETGTPATLSPEKATPQPPTPAAEKESETVPPPPTVDASAWLFRDGTAI